MILHRPGVQADAGQVYVNSLLPLAYEDLGAGGVVILDGAGGTNDLLIYEGTSASTSSCPTQPDRPK